jgi:hypothetical protein
MELHVWYLLDVKWTKWNAIPVGIKILKHKCKNGFVLIWNRPCYYICTDSETDMRFIMACLNDSEY